MSLRVFHLIFIVCSILVTLIFAFWSYSNFQVSHAAGYLWTSLLSLACAAGLVVYEILFLKKVKE